VRLGLLSTANINRQILGGAAASDRVEVVAVASRDELRAQAYALEHAIPRPYGSYDDLLADGEVDAVYVSLPNGLHHEWTLRALAAGKHVLCEKPYSRRAAEAEEAFDVAERAGLVLMEAFMYRHHPQTRRVAELVAEGAIGRLRFVRTAFSFALEDDTNVRALPELDGGALMDIGCYCVSGARLFAGEPYAVTGVQVLGPTGVDVAFHATLELPDEVIGQFDCSFQLPQRQRLEAYGEDGSLVVEAPWRVDWGGDVLLRRGDELETVEVEEANSYQLELENLAGAIAGEAEPLLGRDDAVAQARAIEALYSSAAERRTVSLRESSAPIGAQETDRRTTP
jgi:D-xylose 1-dehydrogenase (NADP+, D-xylono-1,5-lactone-forming)